MPLFDSYLEKHAYNFLCSPQAKNLKDYNQLKAADIVDRFMFGNAHYFLKKNF
jgi:hypothetical protein